MHTLRLPASCRLPTGPTDAHACGFAVTHIGGAVVGALQCSRRGAPIKGVNTGVKLTDMKPDSMREVKLDEKRTILLVHVSGAVLGPAHQRPTRPQTAPPTPISCLILPRICAAVRRRPDPRHRVQVPVSGLPLPFYCSPTASFAGASTPLLPLCNACIGLCSHVGAPLVKGVLSGTRVTCPWHGACFNTCNGEWWSSMTVEGARGW